MTAVNASADSMQKSTRLGLGDTEMISGAVSIIVAGSRSMSLDVVSSMAIVKALLAMTLGCVIARTTISEGLNFCLKIGIGSKGRRGS